MDVNINDYNKETIYDLVASAIISHNEEYVASLMCKLFEQYIELASLATEGEYKKTWTHEQVLNFVTYGEKYGP